MRRVCLFGLTVVACASAPAALADDPSVVVHERTLGGGQVEKPSASRVPVTVRHTPFRESKASEVPRPASGKVDGRLVSRLRSARDAGRLGGRVRVIISFREDQRIPEMPDPVPTLPPQAPPNLDALARADALVEDLRRRRAPGYRALSADLAPLGVDVVDRFWLIRGVVAEVPVGALAALSTRPGVRFVEPVETGAPPPADLDPDNDLADARALIRTDPYFYLAQAGTYVGLLDTGVRDNHTVFNAPSNLRVREDLTNPANPNPDDDCWNHGTSSAAMITANENLGFDFRGITAVTLDSFKVYPAACGGLDGAAAVAGFQRAVQVLDQVIVAEMQAGGDERSAISAAADAAFDAGAAVIAANGNYGPDARTVAVPAVAQKALGVGAVDLKTGETMDYQSRGPAPDFRHKPDIQAPTNIETASSADPGATQVFGGTSAATPMAAGVAALIRGALGGELGVTAPGDVYAFMILYGTRAYPFDDTAGAGPLRLPLSGSVSNGAVGVGDAETVEIPITVDGSENRLDAALWWPEAPDTHNDIDLALIDPSGSVRAVSDSGPSVFERVSLTGEVEAGTWRLRIRGYSVPSGQQRVHFVGAHTTS